MGKIWNWVKDHKRELALGGLVLGGLALGGYVAHSVGVPMGVKVPTDIAVHPLRTRRTVPSVDFPKAASTIIEQEVASKTIKTINNGEPFSVSGHLRTLPDGWHASARQIALAEEQGFSLADNQTYVSPSLKNVN